VRQADESKILREELGGNFQRLGARVSESLTEASGIQKERLENVTSALGDLSGKLEKALEKLRTDNAEKPEQMRITVDEKLQGTLEQRLDASFKQVSTQLEQVFRGVGDPVVPRLDCMWIRLLPS
jgi:DNA recombination protein RmuC